MMETRQIHYNPAQLRSALVDAPMDFSLWGRGTGKTTGPGALRSSRNVVRMPRSTGVFVAATFQQLLTRTLPPVIAGWEKLGYRMGVHYIVGRRPTEKWIKQWGWRGAYQQPLNFQHYITWFNGTGIQMISQDRIGSSNGISIDWIYGDEAKLLNHDRLKVELFPANRGALAAFGDEVHHHGMMFTTDMPMGTSGRWLFDYEKQTDQKRVMQILQLQVEIQQLKAKIISGNLRASGIHTAERMVQKLAALLPELRRGLVYYNEASTLDNIHSLGPEYIRQMARDLNKFEFETAILNRRPIKIEDGFYPDLNEEKHGYFAYNYNTFENTGYDFGKLLNKDDVDVDSDYDTNKSLQLALDYNRRITPAVVGQVHGKEIRIIKGMHSLYPEKLKDTLNKFCEYYKNHKKRVVHYWFDHTVIGQYSHAGSQYQEVVDHLNANGWTVIEHYIGRAAGHDVRYTMYGHLLQEQGKYEYHLRINRDRAPNLLLSMFQTQAVRKDKGFGKSKATELDDKFPAEEAPHYGEALDMMMTGMLETTHGVPSEVETPMTVDSFMFM